MRVRGGPARNARVSCLRCQCDKRTLFQALASSPVVAVTPLAVLPTLVPSLLKIRSQLASKCNSCTTKTILRESCTTTTALLLSQSGLRSNLRASNFLGKHALVLHAYACVHTHLTALLQILATGLVYVLKWLNLVQKLMLHMCKDFSLDMQVHWPYYSLQFSILLCTQRLAAISSYNGHDCCCWRED